MTTVASGWGKRVSRRLAVGALSAVAALTLTVAVEAANMAECEAGDPAARIVACDAIVADAGSDNVTRARALVGRGMAALYLSRDNQTALADFTAATRLDPTNEPAFIGKGKLHYFFKEMDDAFAALTTATRLAPDDPVAWNTLGKVYYSRGDYADALIRFEQAIALERRHPNANLNRASALYRLGRKGEALAGYRLVLYLFGKDEWQYGYAEKMIDKIEREQAPQ